MKKLALILLMLFAGQATFAQERALKITNSETQKEIIINENRSIKISTADGQKVKGRFSVLDNSHIVLDGREFALNEIRDIKRNPLLTSIFTTGLLIYGGGILTGFGALIGVLVDSNAYWLMVPGAAMIFTGLKSPNINRKFSKDKNWVLEIVTLAP